MFKISSRLTVISKLLRTGLLSHHKDLDFTVLLCAEGILLVRLKVRGGGAPQLAVAAAGGGAGVVGLALVDEGKHAGLAVGVASVDRSRSVCVRQTWQR